MQKRKTLHCPNTRSRKTYRPSKHQEDEKPYILRLPDHIILEIFFKLSITSLFQCWRVCKAWRFLLSDPHFNKTLISRTPSCLLVNCYGSNPYLKGNFLVDLNDKASVQYKVSALRRITKFPNKHVVGSCNGFLCLLDDGNLSVSNPMTGEELRVVPTKARFESWGFGYSPISNVYKIVMFELLSKSVVTIMTVGSGIWRSVAMDLEIEFYISGRSWIYLNGFLHCYCTCHYTPSIIAFDIENERFQRLPLPELLQFGEFGVLDGRLFLADTYHDKIVVWVMKDYGIKESWTRNFEIRDSSRQLDCCELVSYAQGRVLLLRRHFLYTYTLGTNGGLVRVEVNEVPTIKKAWIHIPSFVSFKNVIRSRS